jgi:hypothetical protein
MSGSGYPHARASARVNTPPRMRVITLSCGFTPQKMPGSAPAGRDYFRSVEKRS